MPMMAMGLPVVTRGVRTLIKAAIPMAIANTELETHEIEATSLTLPVTIEATNRKIKLKTPSVIEAIARRLQDRFCNNIG